MQLALGHVVVEKEGLQIAKEELIQSKEEAMVVERLLLEEGLAIPMQEVVEQEVGLNPAF